MTVRISTALRGPLAAERQQGRSNSAGAALRRMVERELGHGYRDCGDQPVAHGKGYRLQLGRAARQKLADLSQQQARPQAYILSQLLAAAAARRTVPSPDLYNVSTEIC